MLTLNVYVGNEVTRTQYATFDAAQEALYALDPSTYDWAEIVTFNGHVLCGR